MTDSAKINNFVNKNNIFYKKKIEQVSRYNGNTFSFVEKRNSDIDRIAKRESSEAPNVKLESKKISLFKRLFSCFFMTKIKFDDSSYQKSKPKLIDARSASMQTVNMVPMNLQMPKERPPKVQPRNVPIPLMRPSKMQPPKEQTVNMVPMNLQMPKERPPKVAPRNVQIPMVRQSKVQPRNVQVPLMRPSRMRLPEVQPRNAQAAMDDLINFITKNRFCDLRTKIERHNEICCRLEKIQNMVRFDTNGERLKIQTPNNLKFINDFLNCLSAEEFCSVCDYVISQDESKKLVKANFEVNETLFLDMLKIAARDQMYEKKNNLINQGNSFESQVVVQELIKFTNEIGKYETEDRSLIAISIQCRIEIIDNTLRGKSQMMNPAQKETFYINALYEAVLSLSNEQKYDFYKYISNHDKAEYLRSVVFEKEQFKLLQKIGDIVEKQLYLTFRA